MIQEWFADKIREQIDISIEVATEKTAKKVADKARREIASYNTSGGSLPGRIDARKSIFDGYIVGVFGPVLGKKDKWEDSVGGRAHFFEYGRSTKGEGRGAKKVLKVYKTKKGKIRSKYINSKAQAIEARPQPPRPFLRPAKIYGDKIYKDEIEKELGIKKWIM